MFDLKTRKTEKIREGITAFSLSSNGEKMLYRQEEQYFIAAAGKAPPTPPADGSGGPLKLDATGGRMSTPRAEWKHMYHQVWRDERDFLYDPGLHGLNREAIEKKYEPYLDNISSRDDLNYLFEEMLGEMTVGHMFVGGGDHARSEAGQGRSARRRLHDRKWALPLRARFQWRELEPPAARRR